MSNRLYLVPLPDAQTTTADEGVSELIQQAGLTHHAQRATAIAEGDQPIPDVLLLGVHAHQDLVAVHLVARHAVLDMGEVGLARGKLGGRLQLEQAGKQAAKARGVERETGPDLLGALG